MMEIGVPKTGEKTPEPKEERGKRDVADVVLFCVSPLARWMSGCAIPVDGGGEGAAYLDAATGEVNRT